MSEPVCTLSRYEDDRGNVIDFDGTVQDNIRIKFRGSNNRLTVAEPVRIAKLFIDFDCDNGSVTIGRSKGVAAFSAAIRVGQDATVSIGQNVSSTSTVAMSAVEGVTISVGDDVMFASDNELRADDGHPIFDVRSGERVNIARSITIGSHVWVGRQATLLAGAQVGNGSVIGYRSVVTKQIPNNCVAVGSPAKVVRRDIAWERPHLSLTRPYYKPDSRSLTRTERYWNPTREPAAPPTGRQRLRRAVGRVTRGLRARISRSRRP